MKNIKPQMIIDTLLKLAVIIALIVAVTTKQHYSYYNFLRWLITAAFTVSTYIIVQRHCEEEARRQPVRQLAESNLPNTNEIPSPNNSNIEL